MRNLERMSEPEAILRLQQQHIDTVGWSVTNVAAAADAASFSYTVGLTEHGYPELVIAGLPSATGHTLLNNLARRVYDRAVRFHHGLRITDLFVGFDAVIVTGAAADMIFPGTHTPATAQHTLSSSRSSGPIRPATSSGIPTTPTRPPSSPSSASHSHETAPEYQTVRRRLSTPPHNQRPSVTPRRWT
jgi:hypothetical protein